MLVFSAGIKRLWFTWLPTFMAPQAKVKSKGFFFCLKINHCIQDVEENDNTG